jgi:hypothetical protein
MTENSIVVTKANDERSSDEERWRTNLQRWNSFTQNQKWEAFFDQTLIFHNDYILTAAYTSGINNQRMYMFPRRLQEKSEVAVAATLQYFDTDITNEYEEELKEEYFRENGHPESDEEDVYPGDLDDWYEIKVRMSRRDSDQYEKFINCLPFCVPVDLGSCAIIGNRGNKEWYCPCNKLRFSHFRSMYNISDDLGWKCKSGVMNSYNSLMQHLIDKTKGSVKCNSEKVIHRIIRRFLTEKYEAA